MDSRAEREARERRARARAREHALVRRGWAGAVCEWCGGVPSSALPADVEVSLLCVCPGERDAVIARLEQRVWRLAAAAPPAHADLPDEDPDADEREEWWQR